MNDEHDELDSLHWGAPAWLVWIALAVCSVPLLVLLGAVVAWWWR